VDPDVDRSIDPSNDPASDLLNDPANDPSKALIVEPHVYDAMTALALAEYPLEACGLMAGEPGSDRMVRFFPCRNVEKSARIYTIDPKDHLRAERAAEDAGLEIRGVMHSHTHTEAYPSPTDVAAAPDPGWHYVIVTLKREKPEARTYRIMDGSIAEVRLEIRD
jgi:proteasome lid subunit RPN8/RPN11